MGLLFIETATALVTMETHVLTCSLCSRFELEDEEMKSFTNMTKDAMDAIGNGLPADFIPWLRFLPTSTREKNIIKILKVFRDFLQKHVDDHKEKHESGKLLNVSH